MIPVEDQEEILKLKTILMDQDMKGKSTEIEEMGRVFIITQTEINTLEIGKMINFMEWVFISLLMASDMKVSYNMEVKMVKVSTSM